MIYFTASIRPKKFTRYCDANVTTSLNSLLTALKSSLKELEGKVDAGVKSLFNTAIKSVTSAINASKNGAGKVFNVRNGVKINISGSVRSSAKNLSKQINNAIKDVKKIFTKKIPNEIKQKLSKAIDLVIKFLNYIDNVAKESKEQETKPKENRPYVIDPKVKALTASSGKDVMSSKEEIKEFNKTQREIGKVRSNFVKSQNEKIKNERKKRELEIKAHEKEAAQRRKENENYDIHIKALDEFAEANGFSLDLRNRIIEEYRNRFDEFKNKTPAGVIKALKLVGRANEVRKYRTGREAPYDPVTESIINLKKEANRLQSELLLNKQELNKKDEQIKKLEQAAKEQEKAVAKAEKAVEDKKEAVAKLEKAVDNKEKVAEKLEKAADDKKKDAEKLEKAAEDKKKDAEKLEKAAEDKKKNAEKLENTAKSPDVKNSNQQKQIKEEAKQLKVEATQLNAEAQQLKVEAKQDKVEAQQLKEDSKQVKEKAEQTKVETQQEKKDVEQIKKEIKQDEKEIKQAKTEVKQAKEQTPQLKAQLSEAKSVTKIAEKKIDDAKKAIDNKSPDAQKKVEEAAKSVSVSNDLTKDIKLGRSKLLGVIGERLLKQALSYSKKAESITESNKQEIKNVTANGSVRVRKGSAQKAIATESKPNIIQETKPNTVQETKTIESNPNTKSPAELLEEKKAAVKDYMVKHGYIQQARANRIALFNKKAKAGEIKGDEPLEKILSILKIGNPTIEATQGSRAKTMTNEGEPSSAVAKAANAVNVANSAKEISKAANAIEKTAASINAIGSKQSETPNTSNLSFASLRSELSKWLKEHGYKQEEANSVITELIKKSHKFEGKSLQYALSELQPTISAIDDEKARKKTRAEFISWLKAQMAAGRFGRTKAQELRDQFDDRWDTFTGTTLNDVLKVLNLNKDNPKQSSVSLNVSSPSNEAAKTVKAETQAKNAVENAMSSRKEIEIEGSKLKQELEELRYRSLNLNSSQESADRPEFTEKEYKDLQNQIAKAINLSNTSPEKAKEMINFARDFFESRKRRTIKKTHYKTGKNKGLASGDYGRFLKPGKSAIRGSKKLSSNKNQKRIFGINKITERETKPEKLFGARSLESISLVSKIITNSMIDRIDDATKDTNGKIDRLKFLVLRNTSVSGKQNANIAPVANTDYKSSGFDLELESTTRKYQRLAERINSYFKKLRDRFGYSDIAVNSEDEKEAIKHKNLIQEELSGALFWLRGTSEEVSDAIKNAKKYGEERKRKSIKEITERLKKDINIGVRILFNLTKSAKDLAKMEKAVNLGSIKQLPL